MGARHQGMIFPGCQSALFSGEKRVLWGYHHKLRAEAGFSAWLRLSQGWKSCGVLL